jgi:hypothetical protein
MLKQPGKALFGSIVWRDITAHAGRIFRPMCRPDAKSSNCARRFPKTAIAADVDSRWESES